MTGGTVKAPCSHSNSGEHKEPSPVLHELRSTYSREEIWKINREFLSHQIDFGRDIYLSSNPFQYIGDGSYYGDELQFLADAGFSFVEEAEGLWHAIR